MQTWSSPWYLMAKATPAASGMWLPTMAWPPRKPFSASKKCIEPPLPFEQPGALPSSSAIACLGVHAPGEGVAVVAVGGDDVVVLAQDADRTDGDGFLSAVEVAEAADLLVLVEHGRRSSNRRIRSICRSQPTAWLRVTAGLTSVVWAMNANS